jgi:hypothetical protein
VGNDGGEALQRRLTEIMSAAGVPHSRASLEVLYMLPPEFLRKYSELFDAALKFADSSAGERGEEAKAGVGGAYRGKRPMVGAGGKRYKEHWVIRSEDAFELKKRVDKRLRALGRELLEELRTGENNGQVRARCARCGRIFGRDWNFCAGCGNHRPVGDD